MTERDDDRWARMHIEADRRKPFMAATHRAAVRLLSESTWRKRKEPVQ